MQEKQYRFPLRRSAEKLPDYIFRIGEGESAHIGQFPNLRAMAFYLANKGPYGMSSLGILIGDAAMKFLHPWPVEDGKGQALDPSPTIILDVLDLLNPLSTKADLVRVATLCRIAEFLDFVLIHPERAPELVRRIDGLSRQRLTDRARAILETGEDPGEHDLLSHSQAWRAGNVGS